MKRLFWVGVGVAVGVYSTRRASAAAQRLTPAGIGANLADGLRELGAGIGAFGAEVRAGMQAREEELNDLVQRRTGEHVPSLGEALFDDPPPQNARARGAHARARRAGA